MWLPFTLFIGFVTEWTLWKTVVGMAAMNLSLFSSLWYERGWRYYVKRNPVYQTWE